MSEQAMTGATANQPSAPMTEAGASPVSKQNTETEQAQGQAQAPKEQKAAPAKPELFEVKVDGKVVKMTRDEILRQASLGHAADRRFQEAAQMRKQAEAVIGRIRDPKQVITALQDPALGLNKEQIREAFEEWYLAEFIEPEKMSPEQKKLKEAEARLKRYEDLDKEREEKNKQAEQEAMTSQAREQLQSQIIEALETSGLPKTNFTIRRLAYWMQRNHANGFDAPMEVVVGQVKNEIDSSLRDLVQASDGEVLVKLLGDDVIKKLRMYDLEQLKKTRGQASAPVQQVQSDETKTDKHGRPLTSAEVNQRIRNLQKTGKY